MVTAGVWSLLLAEALLACGGFVINPLVTFYALQLGATAFVVSLMAPALFIPQMVCNTFMGPISSRMGRRPVLVRTTLFAALAYLIMSTAQSIEMLLLANAARGVAFSSWPIVMSYFMEDATSDEEFTYILTLQRLALSVGALSGPLVGRLLVKDHSFQFMCRGLVALNLLVSLLYALTLSDTAPAKDGSRSPSRANLSADSRGMTFHAMVRETLRVFKDPIAARLLGCYFISNFFSGISEGPEIVFLKDHFGFDQAKTMEWIISGTIAGIIGASLVQPLLHGIGPFPGITAYQLTVLGTIGSAVCAIPLCFSTTQWAPFFNAVAVSGIFTNMWNLGFMQLTNQRCPKNKVGGFLGILGALGSAGTILGPPLGGAVYVWSNYAPTYFSVFAGLAMTLLYRFWLGDKHDENILYYIPDPSDSGPTNLAKFSLVNRPVMTDKAFVSRIAMQEQCFRFDSEVTEVYQLSQEAPLSQSGFVAQPFSATGDHPAEPVT